MLLRSLLFAPGTKPDRFARAMASGADAVVFDLEDSVEASRKADARNALSAFLSHRADATTLRLVRINAFGSPWLEDDLACVESLTIDGVVMPKAETAAQVEEVARRVASLPFFPLLETARGILNALSIASVDAAVPALLFGAEDLTAEVGVPRTVDGDELLFARSQVVLAATAAGAQAIDAVFAHVTATDDLRRDALRARALGFLGKMAIHPDQVSVINDVFSPSDDEIEAARRIVDSSDAAAVEREGVIRLDNQMVDAPVVLRARRVLSRATLISQKTR
jgi:citrate lyase subunit beta/citryl-CoA lyase